MNEGEFHSNAERYATEDVLRFLVMDFYQQAGYIKDYDAKAENFNKFFEAGKLFAYSEVLETIRIYAKSNDIDLDNIGFDQVNPYEVIKFKPKNWENGKPLI
jgi:hypothetical protein